MKLSHTYRIYSIGILFVVLLTLAACSGNSNEANDSNDSEKNETSVEEDITMQTDMGEVTIPKDAEKIMAPFHEDLLLVFDVTPIAKWAIGESVQDYLEPELKDIPTIEWDLPLEQVLEYDPDLIILEHNMDSYDGTYEDYSKIAPTYVMSAETTKDWRKQIEVFGEMLDKEDKADDILDEYEKRIADAGDTLKNAIGDESVAAIWVTGDQFFLFEKDRHSAEMIYSELSLQVPDLVAELGEAEEAWNPISTEKLSKLDADHIFLLATEDEQGLKTLDDSAVWQSVPAVKDGNVHYLEDASNWTNTGLKASYKTIDDLIAELTD